MLHEETVHSDTERAQRYQTVQRRVVSVLVSVGSLIPIVVIWVNVGLGALTYIVAALVTAPVMIIGVVMTALLRRSLSKHIPSASTIVRVMPGFVECHYGGQVAQFPLVNAKGYHLGWGVPSAEIGFVRIGGAAPTYRGRYPATTHEYFGCNLPWPPATLAIEFEPPTAGASAAGLTPVLVIPTNDLSRLREALARAGGPPMNAVISDRFG
jgi:hypothetical protein